MSSSVSYLTVVLWVLKFRWRGNNKKAKEESEIKEGISRCQIIIHCNKWKLLGKIHFKKQTNKQTAITEGLLIQRISTSWSHTRYHLAISTSPQFPFLTLLASTKKEKKRKKEKGKGKEMRLHCKCHFKCQLLGTKLSREFYRGHLCYKASWLPGAKNARGLESRVPCEKTGLPSLHERCWLSDPACSQMPNRFFITVTMNHRQFPLNS